MQSRVRDRDRIKGALRKVRCVDSDNFDNRGDRLGHWRDTRRPAFLFHWLVDLDCLWRYNFLRLVGLRVKRLGRHRLDLCQIVERVLLLIIGLIADGLLPV